MGVQADFGIKSSFDDKGIAALLSHIDKIIANAPKIAEAFGVVQTKATAVAEKISQSFVDSDGKITTSRTRASDAVNKITISEQEIAERASQAAADAALRYSKLKVEYESKSLDQVRSKIMEFEENTRTLRNARTTETDVQIKKELQSRINATSTELQLYRSLEKEKTGARTFTEQLEKQGTANAEHLKASWSGVFKNIVTGQGELTKEIKHLEGEHKASLERMEQAATAEAKAEVATRHAAIEKELAEIKHRNEESKEHAEGGGGLGALKGGITSSLGPLASMAGPAGIAAGLGAALTGLIEKGKQTAERAEEIKIGLMSAGMGAEEAEKALKKVKSSSADVSHELLLNKADVENATAAYLKMGGTTDNLKQKQEDIAALARKSGVDMEMAAKMYAKSGDPEISANLKKFGIDLTGVTDGAERARIIHEKLNGTLEGMKEAANSPLGGFQRMQQSVGEITGAIGSLLFEALGPLFAILGEVGKAIQDYVVPAVKVLINVALFPLKTAIEFVYAGFKAAITMFVSVAEYVGRVTGITTLLTNAWGYLSNAVGSVIGWFNKAKETVSGLGDKLLGLLGVQDKAKGSTEELTKAREKERDATRDVAKAADDYTASLQKNQEEQSKSAKQGQDNAIAAIVDIKNKLKTATGDEKKILEERLAQWQAYGKKQVASAEDIEKQKHEASLAIGAAVDADDKSAMKAAKQNAKSKEDTAKESADRLLNQKKESIAAEVATDSQKRVEAANAEIEHAAALLAIAQKFHGEKSKQAVSEQNKLTALRLSLQKDERAASLADLKSGADDAMAELENRGVREHLTEKQIAAQRFEITRKSLADEIELRRSWGEDVSKLSLQLSTLTLKNAADVEKQRIESLKQSDAVELEIQKQKIDAEKDGIKKKLDLIDFQHRQEMLKLNESLEQKHITQEQYDALALNEKNKNEAQITLATKEEEAKRATVMAGYLKQGLDMAKGTWQDRFTALKNFLWQEIEQIGIAEVSKLLTTSTAQEAQTGIVAAGFLARQATYVAEGIASAASAAGTWIATAAKAVYNAFETMPFPLDIIAAAGSIAGVVALSTQVPKLFKGHKDGVKDSPGGMFWHGEAGPELYIEKPGSMVVPNHDLPKLGGNIDIGPLISRLDSIHRATLQNGSTFAQRPQPVLPVGDLMLNRINSAIRIDDRTSI